MKETQKVSSREVGLKIGWICGEYFLKLEHLHYGYWGNGLNVDIANLGIAQDEYVEFLLSRIPDGVSTILDVGCGAGRVAQRLLSMGYDVDCVSPSAFLTEEASKSIGQGSEVFTCKFEELETDKCYDLILFVESFQYIKLVKALENTMRFLNADGHMLVCDYFKRDTTDNGAMKGGHDYHYYHYHYHPHYYSYGCAARYDYYYGSYYRSARYYGPHGGAGGWAGYDPARGAYYRGGYAYGPYGAAFAREAYNPYTDRYGAQARVSTPYQSWGRTVISDGDDWVRAGHRSRGGKTIAGLETSDGVVAGGGYNKWTNQGAVVGKHKHGDVYVGRDGTIYRRSGENWQRNDGDGWQSIDTTQARSQARSRAKDVQSQTSSSARSTPDNSSSITRKDQSSVQGDLRRNFESRQRGDKYSQGFRSKGRSVGGRRRR